MPDGALARLRLPRAGRKAPGTLVELFSVSAIGAYNYIPTWRFLDDGAIEIAVGATGTLQRFINNNPSQAHRGWPLDSASNRIGVSHLHNYYFRLDFDLGESANDDVFERIEEIPDGSAATRTKTITAFTAEAAEDISPDNARSWRVRDGAQNSFGHPISYELVPLESGHRDVGPSYEPFTENAIYVTRYKSNERYISHNDDVIPGGPDNVTEFISPAESLTGADIVVWYGIQFHHIPRDEDEARMHAHWSTFRLAAARLARSHAARAGRRAAARDRRAGAVCDRRAAARATIEVAPAPRARRGTARGARSRRRSHSARRRRAAWRPPRPARRPDRARAPARARRSP